jgi:hypothetical protein
MCWEKTGGVVSLPNIFLQFYDIFGFGVGKDNKLFNLLEHIWWKQIYVLVIGRNKYMHADI